jgi:hypothetical protein
MITNLAAPVDESPSPRWPLGTARELVGSLWLHRDRLRLRSVTAEGRHVGAITDIVLDAAAERVVGFEVCVPEGERCFVPLVAAASIGPAGIEIASPLHVVGDARFYRVAGRPLSTIRAAAVRCRHRVEGSVADVCADMATGAVVAFELSNGRTVPRGDVDLTEHGFRVSCSCRER